MSADSIAGSNMSNARRDFYDRLRPLGLAPLWEVLAALVTPCPRTPAIAARWRFAEIKPLLLEASELISAAEAERRVLILENPALPDQSRVTATLYAGLQLILPGEVAPAHRHSQSALRFVMAGEGAFTALDGERAYMGRYDLILTPNWIWHDHGNDTDQPMIWLDGLDIPLVLALDASFAEHRPTRDAHPATRPPEHAQQRWGRNLRPARLEGPAPEVNPLGAYRYEQWRATLEAMRGAAAPHAHDGYRMEFINPVNGGSIMSTMSAFAQLIPAAFTTRPIRSTDGAIMVVTQGTGHIVLGAERLELAEGDIVVAPSWVPRQISADEDLIVFSYSDKAAQEKLGLWREDLL
jgi:gentisate 1,2-dioxygenase